MGSAMEYMETILNGTEFPETEEEAVEMLIESHMRQRKILEEIEMPYETRQFDVNREIGISPGRRERFHRDNHKNGRLESK